MKLFYTIMSVVCLLSCQQTSKIEDTKIIITHKNSAKMVIVRGNKASEQEVNIIQLLQKKIQEKTGILVQIKEESKLSISDSEYSTLIMPGSPNSSQTLTATMNDLSVSFPDKEESFVLSSKMYQSKNILMIGGSDESGVLYGVGKLLRSAEYDQGKMSIEYQDEIDSPIDNTRGIYYAVHCNNWYEDIPEVKKIEDLIMEQGLWGANTLWLWFDISMYQKSPFEENSDSKSKWDRIKQLAKAAYDIGMKVGFVEIANASYLAQVNETIKAIGAVPPEGLLCPHANKEESMSIMDGNYRELYQDLLDNGISVGAFSMFLYDRGGCHCNLCQPWIETGVKFIGRHHSKTINEYFPNADIYISDWHFEDHDGVNEVEWTKEYLKTSDSDWITGIHMDDRHTWDRWADIDQKFKVSTFFDISMIGGWGGFGANPFPERLDTFFEGMRANGISGSLAYTEGIFDDINKVLALQHNWGKSSSKSIVKEYAKWYFNASDENQEEISDVLADMESEWSNTHKSWGNQKLTTKTHLSIDARIDSLENTLPDSIKKKWRWKLIHSRTKLAQLANEISALKGSGYDTFVLELDSIRSRDRVDTAVINQKIIKKKRWLNEKLLLYDKEYKVLYYGIYEGMKNGMYTRDAPDPARWINGFNRGEKWKEVFNNINLVEN